MYNEHGERESNEISLPIKSAPLAGGIETVQDTDTVGKHDAIIRYIKEYAAKRNIVLTADAIVGKSGVGSPSTKKWKGYGSQGQPGLLHKALACKDEKVTIRESDGTYVTRLKWKVTVKWEIRLIGERLKGQDLKLKKTGNGYVGLVRIGHSRDISIRAAECLATYAKSIRCHIFVDDDGIHHIRVPSQYDKKAVRAKIQEILIGYQE